MNLVSSVVTSLPGTGKMLGGTSQAGDVCDRPYFAIEAPDGTFSFLAVAAELAPFCVKGIDGEFRRS